ncbi:ABC transporter permease [Oricola sp.]|uniref:ABC transporter permease n=1 Tax=Oricola sp. TaxID=1979950 RepID=UPI003BAC500C
MPVARGLRLAFRFAMREMRGGLSGFYVFLACIALGTAAIGAVNAVSQSVTAGIDQEGQVILGGDLRFELIQREASAEERAFLETAGAVSASATMRSMARLPDQSDQSLVELKAVDDAYPLFGALVTEPALAHGEMFEERDGVHGAVAHPILLDRLGLSIGDSIRLGDAAYQLRATIVSEPDAVSDGFAFAPRLLVSMSGLQASGLNRPGALVEHVYKLRTPDGTSPSALAAITERANAAFPEAGWSVRSRGNAAPALSANIERFAQFLTLVGLTALVTGGVGVANAVRAFLDSKRNVIATFKCLGAPGGFVTTVYLIQVLAISLIGIAIGLVIASLTPHIAAWALSGLIPLPDSQGLYPGALLLATVFALVTTLAFAMLPLGRARDIAATALFREQTLDAGRLPRPAYLAASALLIAVLVWLAVATSFDSRIALLFLAGVAFSFAVLRLVSLVVQAIARRVPSIRSTSLRLAVGNIHRPGALTPSVVLSLGLGLTLLVSLALIDGNLRNQISGNLPERAPNFFFVDIQNSVIEDFAELVTDVAPGGAMQRVPMLRGRIVALNGEDVAKIELPPEAAWVLRGDRGITYSPELPENSSLVDGEWWPEDHAGEALVSFSAEEAGELGLKIGDTVTVNVLGRNITARIANLRQVQWESLSINFVMVFSPNTFAGAPHAWLATLTVPDADIATEASILRDVTRSFPAVTSVRVKDAIDLVNRLIGQLATAIRAAAAVALVASVLVLAGALAASNRARVHDAVVLKMLGATRKTLIGAFSLEYLILGAATAGFALLAGGAAAWFVIVQIMRLPWQMLPGVALMTLLTALVLTVGFGLAGTWRVLGQKPAPVLRNL